MLRIHLRLILILACLVVPAHGKVMYVEPAAGGDPTLPDPVSQWKFNEGSGTDAFDSVGSNDATLTGATWAGSGNGKFGDALLCDGTNDNASAPDDATLDITGSLTLMGWVYPTTDEAGWTFAFGKIGNPASYFINSTHDTATNNPVYGSVRISSDFSNQDVIDDVGLSTNTWYHLAMVYDTVADTNTLYVDGNEEDVADPTIDSTVTANNEPFQMCENTFGQEFTGRIDDVRIYNETLTEAEINDAMTSETWITE